MSSKAEYPTEVLDKLSRNYIQEIKDNTDLESKYSEKARAINEKRYKFLQSIHTTLNDFLHEEEEAKTLWKETTAKIKTIAGEQEKELDMLMKEYMKEQRKQKRIKNLAEKEAKKLKEAEVKALQGSSSANLGQGTTSSSSSPPLHKQKKPKKVINDSSSSSSSSSSSPLSSPRPDPSAPSPPSSPH